MIEIDKFKSIPGHGVEATIAKKTLLLGNLKLLQDRKIKILCYQTLKS